MIEVGIKPCQCTWPDKLPNNYKNWIINTTLYCYHGGLWLPVTKYEKKTKNKPKTNKSQTTWLCFTDPCTPLVYNDPGQPPPLVCTHTHTSEFLSFFFAFQPSSTQCVLNKACKTLSLILPETEKPFFFYLPEANFTLLYIYECVIKSSGSCSGLC